MTFTARTTARTTPQRTQGMPGTQSAAPLGLTTRLAYLVGPVSIVVYGAVRLLTDSRQPGPGWTAGHLAFLLALVSFVPMLVGMGRLARRGSVARRRLADTSLALALAGTAAGLAQVVIDLAVGFTAADKAEMSEQFDRVQGLPGMMPLVYTVVPIFLYVGLLALSALNVGRPQRPLTLWSPVLVLAGTAAIATNLDLLSLGGACYLLALAPLARPVPRG